MEYYLFRAMELGRLNQGQIFTVQDLERDRCLMPFEIQERFNLPTLKEHWQIPDRDPQQAEHNLRLRKMFRALNLVPRNGDLSELNVEECHEWDERFQTCLVNGRIDLAYQGPRGRRDLNDDL